MTFRFFRPLPNPSIVLLAIILGVLGGNILRTRARIEFEPVRKVATFAGPVMLAAAFYLLICFIRAVQLDLTLNRDGIVRTARITQVEERTTRGGHQLWVIHFTFTDATGSQRDGSFEEIDDGPVKWALGRSLNIRYHPEEPSIFRTLD